MREFGEETSDYIIGLDLKRDQCLYLGRLEFFGLVLLLQPFSQLYLLFHLIWFQRNPLRLKFWWEREDGLNSDHSSSLARLCFPLIFGFFFHGMELMQMRLPFWLTKFTFHRVIFNSLATTFTKLTVWPIELTDSSILGAKAQELTKMGTKL